MSPVCCFPEYYQHMYYKTDLAYGEQYINNTSKQRGEGKFVTLLLLAQSIFFKTTCKENFFPLRTFQITLKILFLQNESG